MAMMNTERWSMRTSLLLIILTLGGLGVMMSMVTGWVYQNLILDNQRKGLSQIIDIEFTRQEQQVVTQATEFARSVQADVSFRTAYDSPDPSRRDKLEAVLEQHLGGDMAAQRFLVFDRQQQLIASTGKVLPEKASLPCPAQLATMVARPDVNRVRPVTGYCMSGGRLLLNTVVPVGATRPQGYLQALSDPLQNLQAVEAKLGMPMTVKYLDRQIAYRSPQWPTQTVDDQGAVVDYTFSDSSGAPLLLVSFAFDVDNLQQKLDITRTLILIGAVLVTSFAILLALLLLQKTALQPLAHLTGFLQRARENKACLAMQVDVTGNREVTQLAHKFNAVTRELCAAHAEVEKLAFTDMLTGLPNRELFYDRLNQLLLMGQREHASFAVFVMDLDRFKFINDTLGHHVGDELLRQAAKRIHAAVRDCDTIARFGGDEFAALLPRVDGPQGTLIVAKRIHAAFSEPFHINGREFQAAISIGMTMCPNHGDDLNQLIKRADVAMYHAKQHHLGYVFYGADIDRHNEFELTLESELKHAIENDGLKLFYQPKIIIGTGEVYGVEVLARWIHPERGFIPPDMFIPMAEQTGMIHPLTTWVLRTALRQASEWHRLGLMLNVAINLSAQSLRDPGLVGVIDQALKEAGIEPHYLTLELTESAVMSDPKRALDILTELDRKGVMLSIDDFGTGYSSLAYLKQLPMDEIKIDRSFVMEMDKDNNDEVIVHSTIDLAHNMGLGVVAEGIESEAAWKMLQSLGCDVGQGYYMCKPTDAEGLITWLGETSYKAVNA
jgi:diguanylate cyclase (GGDEF)-like protein